MEKIEIPTYAALVAESSHAESAFKNDQWNSLLNKPPHESWVKQHPLVKVKNDAGEMVPLRYLPIDKVEFLLTRIYQKWMVEIKSVQQIFNSVLVIIRLHVLNPRTNEWEYQDGVGAMNAQTDKGASAADLGSIKAAAIQMAAPSAESYAIKDAAEKLGAIFGKDLNRRNIVSFMPGYLNAPEIQESIKQSNGYEYHSEIMTPKKELQPMAQATENSQLFNPSDL